jgi:hypothetical protein
MVPAVVGGVLGGLSLLATIGFVAFILHRRREKIVRRITFNRDLMVQRRSALVPPTFDVERGVRRTGA